MEEKCFSFSCFGDRAAHFGQKLHQAHCVGPRYGAGIELRFLPDQGCHQVRIQRVLRRKFLQVGPVRLGKQGFPVRARQRGQIHREIIRHGAFEHLNGAVVASRILVEPRGLGRNPVPLVLIAGGLQFAHRKIHQPAVFQQLRFLITQVIGRRLGERDAGRLRRSQERGPARRSAADRHLS